MREFFSKLYNRTVHPKDKNWLTSKVALSLMISLAGLITMAVWMVRSYFSKSLIVEPILMFRDSDWTWSFNINPMPIADAGMFLSIILVFLKLWEIGSRYIEAQGYFFGMVFSGAIVATFRLWNDTPEIMVYLATTAMIAAVFSLIIRKNVKNYMSHWLPNVPAEHLSVLIELNQVLKEITANAAPIPSTRYMEPIEFSLFCFAAYCVGDCAALLISQGGIVAIVSLVLLMVGGIAGYYLEKFRLYASFKIKRIFGKKQKLGIRL